jgi:hypothetical protein
MVPQDKEKMMPQWAKRPEPQSSFPKVFRPSCGSTAGESGTTLSLINTDHLFLILGGQDVFMRKVPVPAVDSWTVHC